MLWCHGSHGPQADTGYLDGSKQSSTRRENKDGTSILDHKPKRTRRLHNEQIEISRHRIKDSASPLRSPRIDDKYSGDSGPYHNTSGHQDSPPSSRTESSKRHRPVNRKRYTRKVLDPGFNDFVPNPDG